MIHRIVIVEEQEMTRTEVYQTVMVAVHMLNPVSEKENYNIVSFHSNIYFLTNQVMCTNSI
jgi:hypothetical protein